jgi:hypothetical protein
VARAAMPYITVHGFHESGDRTNCKQGLPTVGNLTVGTASSSLSGNRKGRILQYEVTN